MIETDRLLIRKFEVSDYNDLYEYLSNPVTYVFEPGRHVTLSEAEEVTRLISEGNSFFAVVLKQNNKMIGHLYLEHLEPKERLTWELGYIFNPAYQRKGYASEASEALTKYAFKNFKVHRIMARCNPDNVASWKLLEKIGYKREGYFKKYGFVHRDDNGNPIWTDAYEYSRIEDYT